MATVSKNNIYRSVSRNSAFSDISGAVNSSSNINQGDLCWYDISTHLVKITTGAAGDGAAILGVSPVKIVAGVLASPYSTSTDASEKASGIPAPVFGVEATLKLLSGDAFTFGAKVYTNSADAQTVTITANGTAIGHYVGSAVTAGASSTGPVRVYNNYSISDM